MKILGIDPGTATTGWAILEEKGGSFCSLAYGHISTSAKKSNSERLLEIAQDLEKIIKKYKPKEAAVEEIFFARNVTTAVTVSQSRGVVLLTLERAKVKMHGYTPLQVKQALTGYGQAEKKQVQLMVKNILGLKSIPRPDDAADALAIAICHSHSRRMKNLK